VANSRGVPHILEHSVLCGSRKYPIKVRCGHTRLAGTGFGRRQRTFSQKLAHRCALSSGCNTQAVDMCWALRAVAAASLLQEPFVELMKGSLNTFLNAFTYPDRTCYPVSG
jgi:hypothetical protein